LTGIRKLTWMSPCWQVDWLIALQRELIKILELGDQNSGGSIAVPNFVKILELGTQNILLWKFFKKIFARCVFLITYYWYTFFLKLCF
jgi:hypothetical protein